MPAISPLTRVDIADAHGVRNECTPTFYERFEDEFVGYRGRPLHTCASAA